jgi:hypothetical protein
MKFLSEWMSMNVSPDCHWKHNVCLTLVRASSPGVGSCASSVAISKSRAAVRDQINGIDEFVVQQSQLSGGVNVHNVDTAM